MVLSNNLINVIQELVVKTIYAQKPVQLTYGTIKSTTPLKIFIDQRLVLDADFLIMLKSVKIKYLNIGDRVALLREQGGQKYILLGGIQDVT